MKKLNILLLFCLLGCHKDYINAESYDGEYPVKPNGKKIVLYDTQKLGGEFSVFFNNHIWNHWPLLAIYGVESKGAGKRQIYLTIGAVNKVPDCNEHETISFSCPLVKGEYLNNDFEKYPFTSFTTTNCDAGKDSYKLNESYRNWVKIINYDTLSRAVEGNFDFRFIVFRKDINSSTSIYPNNIRIRGDFKLVLRKQ
jgi:hypothetical protein